MTDTLMVGVSGIRGIVGKDLTDDVVARYATAFGQWARTRRPLVVVGRDARESGSPFERAVTAGLGSAGCAVVSVGIAPTPTIQLAVEHHRAGGGIAITASHNPIEWNALKFIGPDGIFLDGAEGARVQELARKDGGGRGRWGKVRGVLPRSNLPSPSPTFPPSTVLLFRGCIMDGLFSHVHDATTRTLQLNGYAVEEVPAQVCCGALHAHAGLRDDARRLAEANLVAFGKGTGDEPIVVNSAGCGAMLKEYAHLVDGVGGAGGAGGAGARFAARVRDVSELLAERGPRPGAPLDTTVAYDPPCHLLHAQRIADPPERVLRAIPVLQLTSLPDAAQCCGSAGLFTLVEPEMSRAVLAPKVAALAQARPRVVATGNPGCLMQLGAGLAAAGVPAAVRHPVELLDESYRAAGYYA